MTTTYAKQWTKKIALFSSIFGILASPHVLAQSDEINQCRVIQDSAKRLICYDTLFGRINVNTGQVDNTPQDDSMDDIDKRVQALMAKANKNQDPFSSDTPRLSGNVVTAESETNKGFGSDQLKQQGNVDDEEITLSIASLKEDYRGLQTFTMSNGQVWRQVESLLFIVKADDLVIIEKGMWGAYYMKKAGSNDRIRVKRIK